MMKNLFNLSPIALLLACLCVLVSCGPASLMTVDGYEFLLNSDGETYSIKSYDISLQDKVLTVPAEVSGKGYPVTEIRQDAFNGNTVIEEVSISSGITKVAGFNNCTSLKTLRVPASVNEINGFQGCASLENVELSSGLTMIGSAAFHSCTALKRIEIPNTVTTIGSFAFTDCSALQSVNIPASVTKIENGVFLNCTALTEIKYGGTVATWNSFGIEVSCPVYCADGTVTN